MWWLIIHVVNRLCRKRGGVELAVENVEAQIMDLSSRQNMYICVYIFRARAVRKTCHVQAVKLGLVAGHVVDTLALAVVSSSVLVGLLQDGAAQAGSRFHAGSIVLVCIRAEYQNFHP